MGTGVQFATATMQATVELSRTGPSPIGTIAHVRRWKHAVRFRGISECYDGAMRSVTALDVRKRFGQIVDEAAAGERIVIERAGQPIAALVPLSDLALVDPERRKAERLRAIDDIVRRAKRFKVDPAFDAAAALRSQRLAREQQIAENIRKSSE